MKPQKIPKITKTTVGNVPRYSAFLLKTLFSPILVFCAFLGNLCLFLGIYIFYSFEQGVNPHVSTWFDALWWGMSTVTTVGYGDIVPITFEGRVAGLFLMVTGLIAFLSFSALLVSIFFAKAERDIFQSQTVTQTEFDAVMNELKVIKQDLQELRSKN